MVDSIRKEELCRLYNIWQDKVAECLGFSTRKVSPSRMVYLHGRTQIEYKYTTCVHVTRYHCKDCGGNVCDV